MKNTKVSKLKTQCLQVSGPVMKGVTVPLPFQRDRSTLALWLVSEQGYNELCLIWATSASCTDVPLISRGDGREGSEPLMTNGTSLNQKINRKEQNTGQLFLYISPTINGSVCIYDNTTRMEMIPALTGCV